MIHNLKSIPPADTLLQQTGRLYSLGHSPIIGTSQEVDTGTEYTIVWEQCMQRNQLQHVLEACSPHRSKLPYYAVLDDWKFPDNLQTAENQRLLTLHLQTPAILAGWQLFMEHRQLFIRVLQGDAYAPFSNLHNKHSTYWTKEKMQATIQKQTCCLQTKNGPLFNNQAINFINAVAVYKPQEVEACVQACNSDALTIKKVQYKNGQWKAAGATSALLRTIVQTIKQAQLFGADEWLVAVARNGFLPAKHPHTGKDIFIQTEKEVIKQHQVTSELENETYTGTLSFTEPTPGKLVSAVQYTIKDTTKLMHGLLRWRLDNTGQRHWVSTTVPTEDSTALLRKIHKKPTLEAKQTNTLNPLAGLLIATSFGCQKIVHTWPQHQSLVGGTYAQTMGTPQAPVLVVQNQEQIMHEAPIFPLIEEQFSRT